MGIPPLRAVTTVVICRIKMFSEPSHESRDSGSGRGMSLPSTSFSTSSNNTSRYRYRYAAWQLGRAEHVVRRGASWSMCLWRMPASLRLGRYLMEHATVNSASFLETWKVSDGTCHGK